MKFCKTILFLAVCCATSKAFTQDIHFSQTYQAPMSLNPALTGALNGSQRIAMNYKNQWKSFGASYITAAISYDATIFRSKWPGSYLGCGLFVYNDKAGDSQLGVFESSASLSGIVAIDDHSRLSTGIQAGYVQRSIQYENLSWDNQFNGSVYDPSLPSGEPIGGNTASFIDISTGLSWSYGTDESTIVSNNALRINAGVALFHVNRPSQQFYQEGSDQLNRRFVFHAGANIGLSSTVLSVLPSAVYSGQGPLRELNAGALFRYMINEESRRTGLVQEKAILFGGYYRYKDAFIPAFMFQIYDFMIGVSYDLTLSGLTPSTHAMGGIEISLQYNNASHLGTRPSLRFL